MADVDAVVVGAGVIGIAVARELSQAGLQCLLVDQCRTFGMETSSRNSEVVHAGFYYPAGSLKEKMCHDGRIMLLDYAARRGIPHRIAGKIVVATDRSGSVALDRLLEVGNEAGAPGLERWDSKRVRQVEPELRCLDALWSPGTAIIDSHSLMQSLLTDFEDAGGVCGFKSKIEGVRRRGPDFHLAILGEAERISCRYLINSAGLEARWLANRTEGLSAGDIPNLRYAKGSYFSCTVAPPFRHLVYPVPEPGGLGIHLTLDLAGRARFGPDVQWIETPDYTVDESKAESFASAISSYWPAVKSDWLTPDYAGVRPKAVTDSDTPNDFVISGPRHHQIPGLVNLFGIESPGLTGSLAIAREVVALLELDRARSG